MPMRNLLLHAHPKSRGITIMRTKTPLLLLLTLLTSFVAIIPSRAGSPKEKGETIAREWDRRHQGFGDAKTALKMILESRSGRKSERRMRINTLEATSEDQGGKSLVIFDHPADIKGTALLSFSNIFKADDQWLYLPALKRVKRISSSNKSGPFVGSEFAYEDITGQELKKYDYKWLRDEPCAQSRCFVLEQLPLYEKSGYTRQIAWYDKPEYRLQRIDYYDRKNVLLKTLTFDEYKRYGGKFWRAHDLLMTNHQTGKKTRLVYEEIELNTGLQEREFNRNSLARVR